MKKHFTKFFALVALFTCSLTATAQTYTNEPLTVTWSMADGASSTAVANPADGVISSSWSMSTNVTVNSTATYGGNTLTKFNPTVDHNPRVERNSLYYVEWTFTPYSGLEFTPTNVSFDAVKCGTGDPTIDVDFIDGAEVTQQLATNEAINRDGGDVGDKNPAAINKSYSITTANHASSNAVKLRIYIGKCVTTKQVAFGRVVISGYVNGTKEDVTIYNISTAKNIEAAGSVTGAGSYAKGASVTLTATANTGYAFVNWTKAGDGEWTSMDNPLVVAVDGDETYTANFKQLYTVSFDGVSDYLASVKNPLNGTFYANASDKFTIPAYAHKYLFRTGGYSFTEWSDGENTHQPGAELTLTENITLTPVFTATTKTLANVTAEFSVTWDLQLSQILFSNLQNANNQVYYTQTASIAGENVSLAMTIDPTSGKINNAGRNDAYAQVNDGTKFTLPAVKGMTIVIADTYSAFTTSTTIAGEAITEAMLSNSNKTLTYTYEGEKSSVDIIVSGPGYLKTIVVNYPITDNSGTVGIEEINANANAKAAKILRDGQLLIERDGRTYNMQGQIIK